jgi:hypothetical protein
LCHGWGPAGSSSRFRHDRLAGWPNLFHDARRPAPRWCMLLVPSGACLHGPPRCAPCEFGPIPGPEKAAFFARALRRHLSSRTPAPPQWFDALNADTDMYGHATREGHTQPSHSAIESQTPDPAMLAYTQPMDRLAGQASQLLCALALREARGGRGDRLLLVAAAPPASPALACYITISMSGSCCGAFGTWR